MGKFVGRLFACAILLLIALSESSCELQQVPQEDKTALPALETIVLIGFRPALPSSQAPGLVRSPISGAVFSAEPVSEAVAEGLSESLFEKLTKKDGWKWVSPREAASAFSRLASSNPTLTDRDIYVGIAEALSAQAVLGGHLYRWHDREGTDYAARHPASVAFDLYLMSAGDGAVLWKGRFDKTQMSLSENLFEIQTFFKAKGRWMTAAELAEIGLDEMVEPFSQGEKGKE